MSVRKWRDCGSGSARQRVRLARAAGIACAIVVAVPASGLLLGGTDQPDVSEEIGEVGLAGLADAAEPFAVLERMESATTAYISEAPDYFDAEIGLPEGAYDLRSNGEGVVGYSLDGAERDVFDELRSHMARRGWTEVPLTGVCGATFLKRDGACTWALATCTQVGSATCVVFRCKAS